VVKAFNNIYFKHLGSLQRPAGSPERSMLAIAGDDEEVKKTVGELLDSLGYDAYDVGPLAEGWRYQRDTAAYAGLYSPEGAGWPPPAGRQVTAELLAEQLDAAVRYADQ
jgi:predicted dinucleotide-binding enzyme